MSILKWIKNGPTKLTTTLPMPPVQLMPSLMKKTPVSLLQPVTVGLGLPCAEGSIYSVTFRELSVPEPTVEERSTETTGDLDIRVQAKEMGTVGKILNRHCFPHKYSLLKRSFN